MSTYILYCDWFPYPFLTTYYVIFPIWLPDMVFHMVTLFCYYMNELSHYSMIMSTQHCSVITNPISSFYNSRSLHWVGDCNLCLWQINFINVINNTYNHMVEMKQQQWKIGSVLWCLLRFPRQKRCSVRFLYCLFRSGREFMLFVLINTYWRQIQRPFGVF